MPSSRLGCPLSLKTANMGNTGRKVSMHQHQQYPLSDLYGWIKSKELILAPQFQRGDIWTSSAQSYFIDTLLRDLPTPSIYIRLVTDLETKTSYREVVDGQQRLATIKKFIDGKLTLDKRAKEFFGKTYETLDDEDQGRFLAYQMSVEQLFGTDDDTVLDIFHRINAYGISLNRQELRHGKFQGGRYEGEFRLAVIKAAERWDILWSKYRVVSVRNRVRLLHHELIAQLLGVILGGVTDGGQPKIDKLYERYDSEIPDDAEERFDQVCDYIVTNFSDVLGTKLGAGPHFMMLFAAVAHALLGIPVGDMGEKYPGVPTSESPVLSDTSAAIANLLSLADVFEMSGDEVPERLASFRVAIAGTTQRIKSRSVRFLTLYRALLPDPV